MSAYDLKPKWLPDEKVIATKLGWEHKDTGEVLVSFASVGGLPNAVESVYLKKHGLTIEPSKAAPVETVTPPAASAEPPKAVTPAPVTPSETGTTSKTNTPAPSTESGTPTESPRNNADETGNTDISEDTLNRIGEILNPRQNESQGGTSESSGQTSSQTPSNQTTEQPQTTTSNLIRFTFRNVEASANEVSSEGSATVKLKSILNGERLGEPEGWTGPFGTENGHNVMRTRTTEGKGFRFIETEGFESDGSKNVTLVVPFKLMKGGSDGGAFTVIPLKNTSIIVPTVLTTHGDNGFKIRAYDTLKIDGEKVNANKEYPYDKWHVAEIVISANQANAFNKVRFGANQNANTSRNVLIGDGTEFIVGELTQEAQERIKALVTSYTQQ